MLGLGFAIDCQPSPCFITALDGVYISQIVCGSYHTLALSDTGVMYAWGINDFSQIGVEGTAVVTKPTVISSAVGRVKDIAASCIQNHPCADVNDKNQVFMWGRCRGQLISCPKLTSFSSLDEVCATVAYPANTFRTLRLNQTSDYSINDSLKLSFEETADFVFVVEGKKIHVHKAILIMRSEVFRRSFLGDWKEKYTLRKNC
ncbi:RCC1 and BTB domain-containing protein 1-like [Cloeon dipterum]|uniref:RCC1 and BTB domain-containing protein 1-like n=1 Tax=Cloeon dipterum TaxID=197152 RepID=UPI0032206F54